ncbi:hypothetical protein [Sphingomonas sp. 10B4]|uniref:hypothetical protein n=1 Tax=Sphingomonas sp. 10B4 TaxID=3048575 RepID=UPI002AB449D3|nr:hypothetical protein [Sphingomonas sp. 10B4]MDY7523539.1 hypothetical protein [Sphingomonas sp. 10B4]
MIDDNGPGAVTLGGDDRALAVAAVKAVLRMASGDEDALIAAFAESALGLAEQFTGDVMIARALRESVTAQGGWQRLGARPVRAISAVETRGGSALSAERYAIDIDAAGDGWVRVGGGGWWSCAMRRGSRWSGRGCLLRCARVSRCSRRICSTSAMRVSRRRPR